MFHSIRASHSRFSFALLISFFFFSQNAFSQTPFLQTLSESEIENTPELISIQQKIANQPETYGEYSIVEMGNLEEFLNTEGAITFAISPEEQAIEYLPVHIEEQTEYADLIWSGKSADDASYLVFVKSGNSYAAFQTTKSISYQIAPAGNNQHVKVKTKRVDLDCAVPTIQTPPDLTVTHYIDCGDERNTCPALINVLFLVTSDDLASFSSLFSISFYASLQQGITNMAFANSDIPNKQVHIRWEEIADFDYTQPPNIFSDLSKLRIVADIGFRQARNADIVFLATTAPYGSFLGVAILDTLLSPSNAHGIFQIQHDFGQLVFQHEIGHVLNAHHNWTLTYGDNDRENCSHAKRSFPGIQLGNSSGGTWATINRVPLSPGISIVNPNGGLYAINDTLVIPYYSNPDINYGIESTGDLDPASNNAKTIRDVGCTVANYIGGQDMTVELSGAPCGTEWDAVVTPSGTGGFGQAPFSYHWEMSTNGLFAGQFSTATSLGTGASHTFSYLPGCILWLRCTVTSSDGVAITRTIKIDQNLPPCSGCSNPAPMLLQTGMNSNIQDVTIFPNPSNGQLVLSHQLKSEKRIVNVDISNTPSGVYFLELTTVNGDLLIQKILNQK